ncbi:efflux RND transporter periplasmic adaptor subunit [Wukongibacter baidiensis]|uniref:efflux RND transporter periplasmic adaptor subunit n=1 Tax=Wukongibacter baidiensis TaxID=1723361 RepID=UPI003D7FB0BD
MKRFLLVLLMMTMICTLVACSRAEEVKVEEKVMAIKVMEISERENPVLLDYIGTVNSKDMVKYSFKSTGKLGRIFVEKGDKVKRGDKLAQLDMQDLNFQLSAAKSSLDTAQLNIKKAKDALTYDKDMLNKMNELFKEGSISQDQYDQVKLKADISSTSYNQAKTQYDMAKTDYEFKLSLVDDATIYATQDGSIVETLYEVGELVPQGHPSVVVRSDVQIVNVGIAQKDLQEIEIGTEAIVDVEGERAIGKVTNISEAPDEATRTYNAEVTVEDRNFRLGSISKVSFNIGVEKGVWIPISAIMANGEDYVYIAKDDRVFKRIIELGKIYEDAVMTKGINEGELLVISGMKNLNDGSKINIEK